MLHEQSSQLNVGSHRSLWKDTSHSDDTCEPSTCSSGAISGRKVAKKHPVLEWSVATSDELYLRAREGPIDLMSLFDPAERYNLLRGPQSAPTAGIEV